MAVAFRPSHADATYQSKYGIQARSGGGRASARETIGRVAAGAIAKQLLRKAAGTEILAWVKRIHSIEANGIDPSTVSMQDIEANIVRCPEASVASQMIERIEAIGREGDACHGVGDAGIRQIGSRSRQGGDVSACHERI
jgi:chorismate synthase